MEFWQEIPNTNGRYQVNEMGEIKSTQPGKSPVILKPRIDRAGYYTVRLSVNGKQTTCFVHRLVAESFLDAELGKHEVNHINGIKTDNRVQNLEWVTHAENMQHAFATGLCVANGKVVVDDLHEAYYNSVREAAEAYGINTGTCRNYLNGNISNKTPLRYGEPIEVHVPVRVFGEFSLLYTRKVIRYI
jgi:hypothetical protein